MDSDQGDINSPSADDLIDKAIRRHDGMLLRWLTRKFGDSDIARDIAQSTYLRVWRYAQSHQIDNPQALIFKTAANLAANEFRSRKLRRSVQLEGSDASDRNAIERVASLSPTPEATTITKQEIAASLEALNGLPAKARRAFILSRFEDKTYPEIAIILEVSESSVEKYIIAALKTLRAVVDDTRSSAQVIRLSNRRRRADTL